MTFDDHPWPALDYVSARPTLEALHMQTQVVGKVKLALTQRAPQWQNVPLWVASTGLTTGFLDAGDEPFAIAFDLVDHQLVFSNPLGTRIVLPLLPRPLRAFTGLVMDALDQLGVRVVINPITVEVPTPTRCDQDAGFDSYDPEVANRFFRILARVETVLETFRANFWGKQTRVGFYWGTFDLAVTRIDLRPVEPGAGMGVIRRVAADAEQAEVGFWPGSERYPKPAFYAFTYPSPAGIEDAATSIPQLRHGAQRWANSSSTTTSYGLPPTPLT